MCGSVAVNAFHENIIIVRSLLIQGVAYSCFLFWVILTDFHFKQQPLEISFAFKKYVLAYSIYICLLSAIVRAFFTNYNVIVMTW